MCIRIKEINMSVSHCLMVEIQDLSKVLTKGLTRLQTLFQKMLTNALSHERMTPLNSIVNLSDLVRKKCQTYAMKFDRDNNLSEA